MMFMIKRKRKNLAQKISSQTKLKCVFTNVIKLLLSVQDLGLYFAEPK